MNYKYVTSTSINNSLSLFMYRRGLLCGGPYISRERLSYFKSGEGSLSIIMCLNLYVLMYMMVQNVEQYEQDLQVCFTTMYVHVYMIS